ncbi:MAG: DUF2807 domain-containing protein [Dehalococcoidales bacterium]|nr:DUF2807 domain-containing protein [Dehalococcoidales bacterium]
MKKIGLYLMIISILLAGIFCTAGCRAVLVPADEKIESGELETRQFDYDEFTDINIDGAFKYEIKKADNWSISITAGSNLFEYINVTKSGQVLDIDINILDGPIWISRSYPIPQAVITLPELTGLKCSGATDGTVTGFRSDANLDISLDGASEVELSGLAVGKTFLDISGASSISGGIRADSIEIDITSAGGVYLEGSADYLTVEAGGASKMDLPDFIALNADITLRDASRGVFNLVETLNARVNGASTLEYFGEPVIGTLDVSGASTFRKK